MTLLCELSYKHGNTEIIELLLIRGASPNLQDEFGRTPLHFAAKSGKKDAIEFLILNCNADPNLKDDGGQTPLHYAAESGKKDAIEFLISNYNADPNLKDDLDQTPLHLAAKSGNKEGVKFLLDSDADLNLKDHCGQTPLHLAAENKHTEIIALLLNKGANPNLKDDFDQTPLDSASLNTNKEPAKLLLKYGANPNSLLPLSKSELQEMIIKPSDTMLNLFPDAKSCIYIEFKIESLIKTLGIFSLINNTTWETPIEVKYLIGSYCVNISIEICMKIAEQAQKSKVIPLEEKAKEIYKILDHLTREEFSTLGLER
jgi:ankyrin repeat protein